MDQPSDPGVTGEPAPAGEMSAVLADAQGRVVDEAVAALERRDQTHRRAASAADRRRYVGDLFGLVAACVRAGGTEPIIASSRQVAADRFAAGFDIAEIQGEFSVLEEVLWRHVGNALAADQRIEAQRLVSTILGAGRDAVARTYVVLASRSGGPLGEQPAAATGDGDAAGVVLAARAAPSGRISAGKLASSPWPTSAPATHSARRRATASSRRLTGCEPGACGS